MEIKQGSVVISKAGRDKGKLLAVVELSEKSAMVCDGKERPVERPKKKNLIHLAPTRYVLTDAETAANHSLNKALNKIRRQGEREVK
ncbi:MAG: KOW domain-containing RNA-binding protein [Clostridiales bacterium]|nr:KOW domain-containing RNA-binding protein [Clostridiales bacterium]MCD7827816.1 KOW domain-containing RNA-binding protein [Clostridiales bacterium]